MEISNKKGFGVPRYGGSFFVALFMKGFATKTFSQKVFS